MSRTGVGPGHGFVSCKICSVSLLSDTRLKMWEYPIDSVARYPLKSVPPRAQGLGPARAQKEGTTRAQMEGPNKGPREGPNKGLRDRPNKNPREGSNEDTGEGHDKGPGPTRAHPKGPPQRKGPARAQGRKLRAHQQQIRSSHVSMTPWQTDPQQLRGRAS